MFIITISEAVNKSVQKMQVNRLLRIRENVQFSLYEENKAKAVQDTERQKAVEGTEKPKPYGSAAEQVCRHIHKKKDREEKGRVSEKVKRKRREKTRMSFSPPPI